MSICKAPGHKRGRRKKGKVNHVEHSVTVRDGRIDEYRSFGNGISCVSIQRVLSGSPIPLPQRERLSWMPSMGNVMIPTQVTKVKFCEDKVDYSVGARVVVVGVKSYATRYNAGWNRRQFRRFLELREKHVSVKMMDRFHPLTGVLLMEKNGKPKCEPEPVHDIGSVTYYEVRGLRPQDVDFLQSQMGDMGWIESIEEIQLAPPSSGSQAHALEFHKWRKPLAKPAKNTGYKPRVPGDSMRTAGGYLYGEAADQTIRMRGNAD